MARLYLHCVLCDRKQADGLLSGAAWGTYRLPQGVSVEHPAAHNGHVKTCPTCIAQHRNWETVVATTLGVGGAALLL